MPKPFDITVEREAIYRDFDGQPGSCPRCGGPLTQRTQTYLVSTRTGKYDGDSFIMGSDFGWFCEACPTVVLNTVEVSRMLSYQKPGWKIGSEFAVLGLINLDAIPKDKRDRPLGEVDNPIPLVEFTDVRDDAAERAAAQMAALWPSRRPRPIEAAKPKKPRRKKKR
jgi:hypothetical protein